MKQMRDKRTCLHVARGWWCVHAHPLPRGGDAARCRHHCCLVARHVVTLLFLLERLLARRLKGQLAFLKEPHSVALTRESCCTSIKTLDNRQGLETRLRVSDINHLLSPWERWRCNASCTASSRCYLERRRSHPHVTSTLTVDARFTVHVTGSVHTCSNKEEKCRRTVWDIPLLQVVYSWVFFFLLPQRTNKIMAFWLVSECGPISNRFVKAREKARKKPSG